MAGNVREVRNYTSVSDDEFKFEIQPKREPALLKGVDIGSCVEKWTLDYLKEKIGETKVTVHVTTNPEMDFINKNFLYRCLPFNELVKRISSSKNGDYFLDEKELYYLRSLGTNQRKDVADITKQFPSVAKDLKIPNFFTPDQLFSSVFRIASPGLQLWTHYDIMDNILIQVQGRKRVVLFNPDDIDYLYLVGDKSAVLNIDEPDLNKFPNFAKANRYECWMESGDILFIPALWFHNVLSVDAGIAVNVFWRNLETSQYDTKDVYGNKDLPAAVQAMQLVHKAVKCLEHFPHEYRNFYCHRLMCIMQEAMAKR